MRHLQSPLQMGDHRCNSPYCTAPETLCRLGAREARVNSRNCVAVALAHKSFVITVSNIRGLAFVLYENYYRFS